MSQQDRPESVASSPGTISPDEIPETDLDHPSDLHPRMADLERRLAAWENGKNAHLKGHRVTDRRRRSTRHSSDSDWYSEAEDEEKGPLRVSFTHLEGVPIPSHRLLILLPIRVPQRLQLRLHESTHS